MPPKAPHPHASPKGFKRAGAAHVRGEPPPLTQDEARDHLEWVIRMHGLGLGLEQLKREGPQRKVGDAEVPSPITPEQVERAYYRYCSELGRVSKLKDVDIRRSLALVQIEQELATLASLQARLIREAPARAHSVANSIAKFMELRAKLEGTLAPVEVDVSVAMDVRVQQATMRVLGGEVNLENFEKLVERQEEMLRLVEATGYEVP